MDRNCRFAEEVLRYGSLEVTPHLGPVCQFSAPSRLDEMDGYVCAVLAEWYGRDSDRKRSGGVSKNNGNKHGRLLKGKKYQVRQRP
jgi:hypothetical protein